MYLDRASLRQCAGDVMICGFAGPTLDASVRELEREIRPLGLIAFARNVGGAEQTFELCRELKDLREGLLLSVDQEGGRVARLRQGVTTWPPMAALGRLADAALAEEVGRALGSEVRALGFDVNFAPVLDVHTNPHNPIIGDRALATSPAAVATLGSAMVRGLQSAQVAACGKHFPGHGDTSVDSHLALPVLTQDEAFFRATQWPPFVAASQAGLAAVMTAHILCAGLDGEVPATLSQHIIGHHLRQSCGFSGLVVSDDIDMKALADHAPPGALGPAGLKAGIDVFLACRDQAAMAELYAGIVRAAESGELPHELLADRAARARAFRTRWQRPVATWRTAGPALAAMLPGHAALAARLQAAAL